VRGRGPSAVIALIAAATGITACSDNAGSEPAGAKPFDAMSEAEHLACAVDISAFTYLMAGGTLPEDRELAGQAALAAAWHHNAYAVPPGAGEQHDRVNRERAALMAKDQPKAIQTRAKDCIASAVAKHQSE
jgi:hypothetical protein